jgi:hypothetical protein
LFPSTPLEEIVWEHIHALVGVTSRTMIESGAAVGNGDVLEMLLAHVEKHHKDQNIATFPRLHQPHGHTEKRKDRDSALARRIDVAPRFYELRRTSPVVYMGIEGSVKGLAMASAGVPTFSVPSVTMWPPELDAFCRTVLPFHIVVIVPDNDWFSNPLVVAQAFFFRTYLRQQFGIWAFVAAPPASGPDKGVDDYLAAGHSLLDMGVVDREANLTYYREWIAENVAQKVRGRRRHWQHSLALALAGLALHAKDGRAQLPYETVAKVMGLSRHQVSRAIDDLLECGALESDRDPKVKRGIWRGHYDPLGLEFAHRPTFTIRDELVVSDDRKTLAHALEPLTHRTHPSHVDAMVDLTLAL